MSRPSGPANLKQLSPSEKGRVALWPGIGAASSAINGPGGPHTSSAQHWFGRPARLSSAIRLDSVPKVCPAMPPPDAPDELSQAVRTALDLGFGA